jgi:histidine transport system substrate-binding protein
LQADAGFLKTPRGKDFAWAGPEVKDPKKTLGEGTAIGVRKEDGELKAKLNKALAEVHQDGTFTKLEKQYFDVGIDQSR